MDDFIIKKSNLYLIAVIMSFSISIVAIVYSIRMIVFYPAEWKFYFYLLVFPIFFLPLGIYNLKYLKLPKNLIIVDKIKKIITLYSGKVLNFNDINSVNYKRSWWTDYGIISINLNSGECIIIKPISDVTYNGSILSEIIYSSKNKKSG